MLFFLDNFLSLVPILQNFNVKSTKKLNDQNKTSQYSGYLVIVSVLSETSKVKLTRIYFKQTNWYLGIKLDKN